ncbi:hypothetical protein DFH27DRAFT_198542 [Peziza echinospora]|nr:hypothetical protein DFH27DRAFT_198542 [Peziza echinospora]
MAPQPPPSRTTTNDTATNQRNSSDTSSSQTPHVQNPTRLSPHWFFPDGDLLLKCGETLFLVHSKTLSAASSVFREALGRRLPPPYSQSNQQFSQGLYPTSIPQGKCRGVGKMGGAGYSHHQQGPTGGFGAHGQRGLSLSARLWIRQRRRQEEREARFNNLHGGRVIRFGEKKMPQYSSPSSASSLAADWSALLATSKPPKVLVVEDQEVNVGYLLYFLYSKGDTPITKALLPHILSLGIRYQIQTFTAASLTILRANTRIHPAFVIRVLHPFLPPPSSTPAQTTITETYNLAISALLDDFPRWHHAEDPAIREEYYSSVPRDVRERCAERWDKYMWDMRFFRNGELFTGYWEPVKQFHSQQQGATEDANSSAAAAASSNRHNIGFTFIQECNTGKCDKIIRDMHITHWLEWWHRETTSRDRDVPRPSRVRRLLSALDSSSDLLVARGTVHRHCVESAKSTLIRRLRRILGRVVGLAGDESEGWLAGLEEEEVSDSEDCFDDDDEDDDDDDGCAGDCGGDGEGCEGGHDFEEESDEVEMA